MSKKMEMRRKIQQSQQNLKEKKKKKVEKKPFNPYERKFGKKPTKSDAMVSKKTKQGKPKTKAQMMATKNIKKYGGTASAAKANKEAMRLKIRKKYLASKKKK